MSDKKGQNIEKNYSIEIIGTIVAITIVCVWYNFFFFNDGEDWAVRGQLGDSFGVLNTLFSGLAFAGIVLTILLQRKELSLQRNELKLTREEFTTNRLTNILYQQINIQQKVISEFSIILSPKQYDGSSAFLYLYKKLSSFTIPIGDKRSEEQLLTDKIAHYRKNLTEYIKDEESLLVFSARTSNSIRVIKSMLANSELTTVEMKQFVDLFFNNIGFSIIQVLEDICKTFSEYIKLPGRDDNQSIDFGRMGLVNIHLENIIKLKNFDFNRVRSEIIKDLLQ